ncbi:MAG TPA: tyrosine-type recombinase/integrase, partial [Chitinophagales bacterium]|nr:tyrosine-type recombinase/integrase [Chitinophagales bacterium]
LTTSFCNDYGDYVKNKSGLAAETGRAYFRLFKQVLQKAEDDRLLSNDLRRDKIRVKFKIDKDAINKQLLEPEEIKKLVDTPEANEDVRRAFILALNTGLDYATCKNICWGNVHKGSIVFERSKTENQNRIPLNAQAKAVLGKPGQAKANIFDLPSWNRCVTILRRWAKNAGIDKKITWHTARHSLGHNLTNYHHVDIRVTQTILGHKDIRTTMRYTKVDIKTKQEALDKLK